jgi:hypothetical protein
MRLLRSQRTPSHTPGRAVMLLTLPCSTSLTPLTAECNLKPSQRVAPRRSGHAAFVVDKIPYVFGGYIEEDVKMPTQCLIDTW